MSKNKTLSVTFGAKDTSKSITIATLERLASFHDVDTNTFIQRLLVKEFQRMLPDDYKRALIVEKASEAMDELALKQYFKALIDGVLSDFDVSVHYLRLNNYTYTYDKDGVKVVLDYSKGKGRTNEYILNIYLGRIIDKELLEKYKRWNHNQLSVRIPTTGVSRAKVIKDTQHADITFKFKY